MILKNTVRLKILNEDSCLVTKVVIEKLTIIKTSRLFFKTTNEEFLETIPSLFIHKIYKKRTKSYDYTVQPASK